MSQWANEIIASFLRPDVDSLIDDYVAAAGTKQIYEFRLEGERKYGNLIQSFPRKFGSFTATFNLGNYGNLVPDPYPFHPIEDLKCYVNHCELYTGDLQQFDVFELCFGNLIHALVKRIDWKEKSWIDVVNDYQINGIDGYTMEKDKVILNTVIKFQ
jgi:hypothetical protein